MATPELKVRVGLELDKFNKGMREVNNSLQKIAPKMKQVGQTMTRNVTMPIGLAGVAMLKTAGDFEQGMNKVRAITQASEQDFKALEDQAKQLGKTTRFSAREASEGMSFLAMAGFETNEIMSAMPNVLTLASSANLDLGRSADIVSNVMQGFGQDAEELTSSVDVLTKAFVSSNTDLGQLGQAMKYVGPVAKGFGISFEEATASVGFLSDAGIQASMAGTSLRRIMTTLSTESDKLGISVFDSSGKMKPLADIIEQLEKKGITASQAMEIFGQRGGPALQVLLERGSDALRTFTGELADSGGIAQSIADTQMEGLNGALIELRSAIEGMFIAFAESGILESFTDLVDSATQSIRGLADISDTSKKNLLLLAGVLAVGGPLLVGLSAVINSIQTLNVALGAMRVLVMTNPLVLLASSAGVALAGLSIKALRTAKDLRKFKEELEDTLTTPVVEQSLDDITQKIAEQAKRIEQYKNNIQGTTAESIEAHRGQLAEMQKILDNLILLRDTTAYHQMVDGAEDSTVANDNLNSSLEETRNYLRESAYLFKQIAGQTISGDEIQAKAKATQQEAITAQTRDEFLKGGGFERAGAVTVASQEEIDQAQALSDRMKTIEMFTGLAREAFVMFGQAVANSLTQAIMQGKKFGDVLKSLLKQLASQALQKFLTIALTGGAGGFLGKIGGGIFGEGGGLFGKIGGALFGQKMATGGVVPAGFPNDTYPALLTSGEMVIPKPHSLPSMTGSAIEIFGEFRVRGSDLVTAISNTNNRTLR